MKQYRYYIILLLTGLVWSAQTVEAQSAAELEKAYKEAYDKTYALAMTNKAKEFEASTKRLMDLCLKTGNEQMYYKAWSNLATYTARSNTYKGLEIADELRKYATEHDSKYGFFISTYTNSYIALRMNKIDLSGQLSEEAIQYKNRYLKDVNGAFIYWQLALIYIHKKQREKAIQLLDKIDDEPDLQPSHHTFKWVYKCDACYSIKPVDTVRFMAYYAELQKAIKKYKHYADPERMADFKYADLTGNYQKMLEIARQKTSSDQRLYYTALAYEKMGQTAKALDTLKAYIINATRL